MALVPYNGALKMEENWILFARASLSQSFYSFSHISHIFSLSIFSYFSLSSLFVFLTLVHLSHLLPFLFFVFSLSVTKTNTFLILSTLGRLHRLLYSFIYLL
ncbi:unnamed protein product [Ilex paraguariensis]|uniref:Uncharacterized protein n=1 Tax=Ilex paraguariensis TaxID=185542 RepID=A0ABC8T2U6_9AQUA